MSVRLNVVAAYPPTPCITQLSFVDASGAPPFPSKTVNLQPGDLINNGDQFDAITQLTLAQFEATADLLTAIGWRLYIVEPFVMPGGQVLYNAVWQPGTHDQTGVYGKTYSEYRTKI
jgi:Bacterial tandem repeat domain 1